MTLTGPGPTPALEKRRSTDPLVDITNRFAPAVVGTGLTAVALAFTWAHTVDWFYNDDLASLRWFAQADAGQLHPWDVIDLWNNEHPVGTQFAIHWLLRRTIGLDMRMFVALSTCVVAWTAMMAAGFVADAGDHVAIRVVAVVACFALAFQPTQMEHLLWSFELGWFVVNAAVVANVVVTERRGPRAAWPAAVLCAAASFASAQGAFTFFSACLHQTLMPARPGRRTASFSLAVGGLLAVAHLLWRSHPSASGPTRPDHDLGGMAIYAVQVLGGLSGLRRHGPILAAGAALLTAAALLLWLRRRTTRPERLRAALVLISFTMFCLGAFARGRHHLGLDWATSTYHAAPLLIPFALSLTILLGAPSARSASSAWLDRGTACAAAFLLVASTAMAWPYGVTRARLWAIDLGYARWATCSAEVPESVAAQASGVDYDRAGFAAIRPMAMRMCPSSPGSLEGALVHRPPLFDAIAGRRPETDRALDALWQDYATDVSLQFALKPWKGDTPQRLLMLAKSDAEKGLGRLGRYADVFRTLQP